MLDQRELRLLILQLEKFNTLHSPTIQSLTIFGSYAEGGVNPSSDFDLAILTNEMDKLKKEDIRSKLGILIPLELDIVFIDKAALESQISPLHPFFSVFIALSDKVPEIKLNDHCNIDYRFISGLLGLGTLSYVFDHKSLSNVILSALFFKYLPSLKKPLTKKKLISLLFTMKLSVKEKQWLTDINTGVPISQADVITAKKEFFLQSRKCLPNFLKGNHHFHSKTWAEINGWQFWSMFEVTSKKSMVEISKVDNFFLYYGLMETYDH